MAHFETDEEIQISMEVEKSAMSDFLRVISKGSDKINYRAFTDLYERYKRLARAFELAESYIFNHSGIKDRENHILIFRPGSPIEVKIEYVPESEEQ